MDAVLLDTDVFSFLSKSRDSRGELYRPYVKGKTIALSFISVGELYVWTETACGLSLVPTGHPSHSR